MPSSFFPGWRPWTRSSSSLPARCREKSGPERLPWQANLVPKNSYNFKPAVFIHVRTAVHTFFEISRGDAKMLKKTSLQDGLRVIFVERVDSFGGVFNCSLL